MGIEGGRESAQGSITKRSPLCTNNKYCLFSRWTGTRAGRIFFLRPLTSLLLHFCPPFFCAASREEAELVPTFCPSVPSSFSSFLPFFLFLARHFCRHVETEEKGMHFLLTPAAFLERINNSSVPSQKLVCIAGRRSLFSPAWTRKQHFPKDSSPYQYAL